MSDNSTKKSNWKRRYRLFKQQEDRQEFEGWTEDEKNSYLTACVSIEERIKTTKKEYVYNVRRIYNTFSDVEKFNKEIEEEGWEVVDGRNLGDSHYILFNIRKEKE